ncbi:MAG: hypothetical protein RLZZ67_183 [Candidatus Parcubacteria bacterium]|jgi:hypothetical protein
MDKKSKLLLVFLVLLVLWSIGMIYYRTMVKHDFSVEQSETTDLAE